MPGTYDYMITDVYTQSENSENSYQSELEDHLNVFDNPIKSRKNVKTLISRDKFVDIFDDNTQETRLYWRTDEEWYYQNQLKNYEDVGNIKLYDGCGIPEEFKIRVDSDGNIITKKSPVSSRIMTITDKILSLSFFK